jgi:hypothetical protein
VERKSEKAGEKKATEFHGREGRGKMGGCASGLRKRILSALYARISSIT